MAAAGIFVACTNADSSDTGLGVLPDDDIIGIAYTDTATVSLTSYRAEKVRSDNTSATFFGNMIDMDMGRLHAELFTQFQPAGASLTFGSPDSIRLDSIVLELALTGYYGRLESPLRVRVEELSEVIPDSAIFSNRRLQTKGNDLCNGYMLDFREKAITGGINIRLDNALGEQILFMNKDTLGNKRAFSRNFKGLKIATDSAAFTSREPGVIYFSDTRSNTLALYYQVKQADGTWANATEYPYRLEVGTDAYSYCRTQRTDFGSRTLGQVFNTGQYHYLQGGTPVYIATKFPYIDKMPKGVINRAELILYADATKYGSLLANGTYRYQPPQNIAVFAADSTDATKIGGTVGITYAYDKTIKGYRLDLSNYTQRIMNGQAKNNGLIITVADTARAFNRAIIYGKDALDSTKRPKLRITYTTLPK